MGDLRNLSKVCKTFHRLLSNALWGSMLRGIACISGMQIWLQVIRGYENGQVELVSEWLFFSSVQTRLKHAETCFHEVKRKFWVICRSYDFQILFSPKLSYLVLLLWVQMKKLGRHFSHFQTEREMKKSCILKLIFCWTVFCQKQLQRSVVPRRISWPRCWTQMCKFLGCLTVQRVLLLFLLLLFHKP